MFSRKTGLFFLQGEIKTEFEPFVSGLLILDFVNPSVTIEIVQNGPSVLRLAKSVSLSIYKHYVTDVGTLSVVFPLKSCSVESWSGQLVSRVGRPSEMTSQIIDNHSFMSLVSSDSFHTTLEKVVPKIYELFNSSSKIPIGV